MNKEEFKEHFGRPIKDDEIIIEFDYPCPDTKMAISMLLNNLHFAEYSCEVWEAEGMFCSHIHIPGVIGLSRLSKKVRRKYRESFLKKYVPDYYYPYVDISLCCDGHRIAEEFKPHFKYGTEKRLIGIINPDTSNRIEEHLLKRAEIELQKEIFGRKSYLYYQGDKTISDIAREFGIEVIGNKALCPFHNDTNPSLFFDDNRGLFNCFGCNTGGGISKFKELLNEQRGAEVSR